MNKLEKSVTMKFRIIFRVANAMLDFRHDEISKCRDSQDFQLHFLRLHRMGKKCNKEEIKRSDEIQIENK